MARFDTVLIANRGEIAVRVIRSARAAGYRTVAVYSDADAGAPHVSAADTALRIGGAAASASYLDVSAVLGAAATSGAQAVHPGYGFLSENADFAQACIDAGLVFIGPRPDAIRLMGDKAASKRRMDEAGVPLLPGYQGEEQDDDRLLAEAAAVGFPLMVKAAAGGGGKGMRLVASQADLADAIAGARREAAAAFGSDVLILERALLQPRHVEIQVLGDEHGNVVALGERDCSVQRRHQKVVEEAPSPALDDDLRARMQQAAVAAASDISYTGAGTVEFLLGQDGTFAFLEMNTRLQVEHPVTELVTGLDLVAWQLRIAQGEPLEFGQDDVRLEGHAIEVRLYAEDPANGYLPQTGTVVAWQPPSGEGVRVDAGITTGQVVSAHYDPMLAKVIAHGRDRDEARRRLVDALDRTVLLGVTSNRAFLAEVLRHPTFAVGEATTAFLGDHEIGVAAVSTSDVAVAATILHVSRREALGARTPGLLGWSSGAPLRSRQRLSVRGAEPWDVVISDHPGGYEVSVGEALHATTCADGRVTVDGHRVDVTAEVLGTDRVLMRLQRLDLDVTDTLLAPPDRVGVGAVGSLVAPMHGSVTAVQVEVGQRVEQGQRLVVLEAMKMEHAITADVAGTVSHVVAQGVQVATDDVLVTIEPDDAEA